MNERIKELAFKTGFISKRSNGDEWRWGYIDPELAEKLEQFAELIVKECVKELREAEQEADRAYKAKEVKERNTFDGYDFADMLQEHFGVEE